MSRLNFASALVAVCLAASASYGNGAYGQGPVSAETPIFTRLVPGQELSFWSPNFSSSTHSKVLSLTGTISGQGSALEVKFDWLGLDGQTKFSNPIVVPTGPNGTAAINLSHTVAFCPERVSVHLRSASGTVTVDSVFKHECIIPEPATGLMGLLGLGGLTLARRRLVGT